MTDIFVKAVVKRYCPVIKTWYPPKKDRDGTEDHQENQDQTQLI